MRNDVDNSALDRKGTRYALYVYVDGYDLGCIAPVIGPKIDGFIGSRSWLGPKPWLVDSQGPKEPSNGDLPRWDFGFNFDLPDDTTQWSGLLADIEAIAVFARSLSTEMDHEFVMGAADRKTGDTWDFAFIGAEPVNMERIARALGVKSSESSHEEVQR
jgi:hypothetical protein